MKATHLILTVLAGAVLTGCSATNRLSMTVTEPAAVSLPAEVQRVGIIDRSEPSEANRGLAKIDAILSAEGMQLDREGARAAVEGLAERLRLSGRFQVVVVLDSVPGVARGGKLMPTPLRPQQLREICDAYGLDAVFSLSFYDTDTRVDLSLGMMEVPNDFGVSVRVPAHNLQLHTAIRKGWRIYLPQAPLPLDVMTYTETFRVDGQGINPVAALESIGLRKDLVMERSRRMGYGHAGRLEPTRVRVGRDYFVRGTDAFVTGRRLAQTGDWDGAANLWEQEVTHPKDKIAGRAHYNMAIINEINGDLDAALQWARDSYAQFGTREALRYLKILEFRKEQQLQLEQQLSQLSW